MARFRISQAVALVVGAVTLVSLVAGSSSACRFSVRTLDAPRAVATSDLRPSPLRMGHHPLRYHARRNASVRDSTSGLIVLQARTNTVGKRVHIAAAVK